MWAKEHISFRCSRCGESASGKPYVWRGYRKYPNFVMVGHRCKGATRPAVTFVWEPELHKRLVQALIDYLGEARGRAFGRPERKRK